MDIDGAVKDILQNRLPRSSRGEYQTVFGSFLCSAAFAMIVQSYPNGDYGSAIVFGYSINEIRCYRMRKGVVYLSVLTQDYKEI